MPNFNYRAKNKKGQEIKGMVEARDKKTALAILREKGLFCYSLEEKKESFFVEIYRRIFKRVSIGEIATLTRQLSTMISAGLPLTEALLILKSQGSDQISYAVGEILRDVEEGSSLADAMQKFPNIFSGVFVALVRAGESAGVLENILARMADNLESQREFNSKVKGALLYPIIIVSGMGIVIFVMMVFVIPKLMSLYKEFNAKLPITTQILVSISNFFVSFWWLILLIFFGTIYGLRVMSKIRAGKRKIDEFKFKLPIFGKLQLQVSLTETTRTLGLLIGAGISLVEALEIVSKATNNIIIEEGLLEANKQVQKGFPLSSAISQNPVFPPILGQMLSVGEETGRLDEVLLKISRFFQSDSEETLKGLTTAIEPLIMIVLGLGVGFLVVAIIMPIYNLTSQF